MKIFAFTLSLFSLSMNVRADGNYQAAHCARQPSNPGSAASSGSEAKPAGSAGQPSAVVDSRDVFPNGGGAYVERIDLADGQIDVMTDAEGRKQRRKLIVKDGIATVEPINNRDFEEVMPVPPLGEGQEVVSAIFKLDRFNQVSMIEITLNDGSKMEYKPGAPQQVKITKADGSVESKILTPRLASTAPDVRRGENGRDVITPQGVPDGNTGVPRSYINPATGRRVYTLR